MSHALATSGCPVHEFDDEVEPPFDDVVAVAVLQPRLGGIEGRVTPCPAITSPMNIDERSRAASTGSGSLLLCLWAGVARQIAAGGIRRPGAHRPFTEVGEQIEKVGNRDSFVSWMTSPRTPAWRSSTAIALPVPPASTRSSPPDLLVGLRGLSGLHQGEVRPACRSVTCRQGAADDADDPEHLRSSGARWRSGRGCDLRGIVTRFPSTFNEAVRPVMTVSRLSSGIRIGTQTLL